MPKTQWLLHTLPHTWPPVLCLCFTFCADVLSSARQVARFLAHWPSCIAAAWSVTVGTDDLAEVTILLPGCRVGKEKGRIKKSKCVLLKCHWGIKHIIPPQHCFFNCLLTPERGYRPTFKGSPNGKETIYTLLSLVPNVGWSNSISV